MTTTEGEIFIKKPLGLICGAGEFPASVAKIASHHGREVFCIKVTNQETPSLEKYPHKVFRLGEVGGILNELNARSIQEICLIGNVQRPNLADLRPDWGALRHVPNLITLFQGGDNHLLMGVVHFLEEQGFKVIGAHEIAPELLAGVGALNKITPTEAQLKDIKYAQEFHAQISPYDVGQSIVVKDKRIIAIEGPEGTDAMLDRVAQILKFESKGGAGVLVKLPKIRQELRVDMPAIGLQTLKKAHEAGLCGIAILSGQVLVLDQSEMAQYCTKNKVFVYGLSA